MVRLPVRSVMACGQFLPSPCPRALVHVGASKDRAAAPLWDTPSIIMLPNQTASGSCTEIRLGARAPSSSLCTPAPIQVVTR